MPSLPRRRTGRKTGNALFTAVEQLESRALLTASVFSISNSQVLEGTNGTSEIVFNVTRYNDKGDYSQPESIFYFTGPGPNLNSQATPGLVSDPSLGQYDDFVPRTGLASFESGEETTFIRIIVHGDDLPEPDEQFVVRLSPDPYFQTDINVQPVMLNYPHSVFEQISDVSFAPAIKVGVSAILVSELDTSSGSVQGVVRVLVNVNPDVPSFQSIGLLGAPSSHNTPIIKAESADFDGDGIGDVLVANQDGVVIYRGLVGQASSFASAESLVPLSDLLVSDVAIADVNNDGLLDVAIADQNGKIDFLINSSSGSGQLSFSVRQQLALPTQPSRLRLADLDGDQRLDVISISSPVNAGGPTPLALIKNLTSPGASTLAFESDQSRVYINSTEYFSYNIQLNQQFYDVEVNDEDGDGRTDLLFATQDEFAGNYLAYETFAGELPRVNGLSFVPRTTRYYGGPAKGFDLVVNDVNHDGLSDSALVTQFAGGTFLILSDITGTRRQVVLGDIDSAPGLRVAIGDLNLDGAADILVANPSQGLSWLANQSNRTGIPFVSRNVAIGTIIDDDTIDTRPAVTLSQSVDTIYSGATGNLVKIYASLTDGQPLSHDLIIPIVVDSASTASDGSTAPLDYTLSSYEIIIPAGALVGEVRLIAAPDSNGQMDSDETVIIRADSTSEFQIENAGPLTITIVSPPEIILLTGNNIAREAGPNQFTIIAMANKPVREDTQIQIIFISSDSTASLDDFTFVAGQFVTIPAGAVLATLTVSLADDATSEDLEYATFAIGQIVQGHEQTVSNNYVTFTFVDNDPLIEQPTLPKVQLSLGQSTIVAGGNSSQSATKVRAELVGGQVLAHDLIVPISIDASSTASPESATNPDYSITGQVIIIPAGQTSGEVTITALADAAGPPEPDETVIVRLVSTSDFVLTTPGPVTVTIASIPEVRLALVQSVVTEGGAVQIQLVAYASRPVFSDTDIGVALVPSDSTVVLADFVGTTSGAFHIPAGQTSATVSLTVADDAAVESTEVATFGLTGVIQGLARLASNNRVSAAILDNDPPVVPPVLPQVRLSLSQSTIVAGGNSTQSTTKVRAELVGGQVLTHDLIVPISIDASSTASPTGATNPDYSIAGQVIVIVAGQTSGEVTITALADAAGPPEADETVLVRLATTLDYVIATPGPVTVTIASIPEVRLALVRGSVTEGGIEQIQLVVYSSRPMITDTDVVVVLIPEVSTAVEADFVAGAGGLIHIPAGQTSASFAFTVAEDAIYEVTEIATFGLSAVFQGLARLASNNRVSATILDNDPQPIVNLRRILPDGSFTTTDVSILESNGTIQLVAVVDAPTTYSLSIPVVFSGTLGRSEFVTTYGGQTSTTGIPNLIIPAGTSRSSPLTISSINDSLFELNESLNLSAATSTTYTVGTRGPVSVTILDDDTRMPQVTLQASATSIPENGGIAGFYVRLDRPASAPITIQLQFSGKASASDFTGLTTVVIPAGETLGTAWIKGTDDVLREEDESLIATISAITGPAEGVGSQANLKIVDDDFSTTVRLLYAPGSSDDQTGLRERSGVGSIFAILTDQTVYDVIVTISTSGTATAGTDYTISTTTIRIPAGGILNAASIQGIADRIAEGNETIIFSIVSVEPGPGGRVVAEPLPGASTASTLIKDDLRPLLVNSKSIPLTVDEDQTSRGYTFRAYDLLAGQTPTTFSVISSNPELIGPSDVTISYRASLPRDSNQDNQQIVVKPKPNQYGTATLTIRATNSAGTSEFQVQVVVNNANDAPRITGGVSSNPFDMSVTEDTPRAANQGTSIASILLGRGNPTRANSLQWTEVDPEPNLRGVAIYAADRTNGNWEYTVDGVTWKSLIESRIDPRFGFPVDVDVAYFHTLLLAADDAERVRIRFLPNPDYKGYVQQNSLYFYAWDQTYGTSGTYIDLNQVTGTAATAFGTAARIQAEVFSANDFPPVLVLPPLIPNTLVHAYLPVIPEQRLGQPIPEFTVSQIKQTIIDAGGRISDEDYSNPGIAITFASQGALRGNWEYNTGFGWKRLSNGNDFFANTLLLSDSSNNRVRFVGTDYGGTNYTLQTPQSRPISGPNLVVRIWDYSAGDSGTIVNAIPGSIYTGSLSEKSASIEQAILNVNDPPTLNLPRAITLGDVSVGDDLVAPQGVSATSVFVEFYNQHRIAPFYVNDGGFQGWLQGVDVDDTFVNGGDIGLAIIAGDYTGWRLEYYNEAGDYWFPIRDFPIGGYPNQFFPIPGNSRIRLVQVLPSSHPGFVPASSVNIRVGFHDGGVYLDNSLYLGLLESNASHYVTRDTFRIFARNYQTGTQTGESWVFINDRDLNAPVVVAEQWWAMGGANLTVIPHLESISYIVVPLTGAVLASVSGDRVQIDSTAAGMGWFVDPTPWLDEEFELGADGQLHAIAGGAADGKYDLMTVLAHELGHVLGLQHRDDSETGDGLMSGLLPPGIRRKPLQEDLDAVFAHFAVT